MTNLSTARLQPHNWLVEFLVIVLLGAVGYCGWTNWQHADAANNFPAALLGLPASSPSLAQQTVVELQRTQPQRNVSNVFVHYLAGSQRSTGPTEVSVHLIDPSTWAAVALGPDGRCYGILATDDGANGENDTYAKFPSATACRGNVATTANVTLTEMP